MNTTDGPGSVEADEIRFMQLVSMFQMASMQQLGKLVNPITNEVDRDLDQARASIDMLEMLKKRSEGNRTQAETDFIDKVLFELHMNYVDEVKAAREEEKKASDGTGKEPEEPADSSGADAGDEVDPAPAQDADPEK